MSNIYLFFIPLPQGKYFQVFMCSVLHRKMHCVCIRVFVRVGLVVCGVVNVYSVVWCEFGVWNASEGEAAMKDGTEEKRYIAFGFLLLDLKNLLTACTFICVCDFHINVVNCAVYYIRHFFFISFFSDSGYILANTLNIYLESLKYNVKNKRTDTTK